MNAEIIAIGSELLLGQICNTNAQFLSKELANQGINVYFHAVVGDNPNRLNQVLQQAEQRSDLIICTGGLGPTKDDLTKETISQHLGLSLTFDEKALNNIKDYFIRTKQEMSVNNEKQALVIEGSTVLENVTGMAPGMAIKNDKTIYMLFPGPPSELKPMFLQDGLSYLQQQMPKQSAIFSRVLRFYGIGESRLETELAELIDGQTDPTIAPLASENEVTLRLTTRAPSETAAVKKFEPTERKIKEKVGNYFYGYDDETLVEVVAKRLSEKQLTVSVAESLTGGLFGAELTSVSGSSSFFKGGVVTYTNEMKQDLLEVSTEVLARDGAISEACAQQMAENVRTKFQSNIGISFTGVAGPNKSEDKEPGLVYIGLATKDNTYVRKLNLSGNRNKIRNRTMKQGLLEVIKLVKKKKPNECS